MARGKKDAQETVKATEEQLNLLVENLERFPAIWNSDDPIHADRNVGDAQKRQLAEIVGIPVPDMIRSYQTLRKAFRQVRQFGQGEHVIRGSGAPLTCDTVEPFFRAVGPVSVFSSKQ